jgi:hypothetical protein
MENKKKKNQKLSSLFPLPPKRIPTPFPVASTPGARERVRLPGSHSNTSKLSTQPPIPISRDPTLCQYCCSSSSLYLQLCLCLSPFPPESIGFQSSQSQASQLPVHNSKTVSVKSVHIPHRQALIRNKKENRLELRKDHTYATASPAIRHSCCCIRRHNQTREKEPPLFALLPSSPSLSLLARPVAAETPGDETSPCLSQGPGNLARCFSGPRNLSPSASLPLLLCVFCLFASLLSFFLCII